MAMKPRFTRDSLTVSHFFNESVPEPNSGCWIWTGTTVWNGYGTICVSGKMHYAHRLCVEIKTGSVIPRNLDVCHKCDVRCCVNPDHLFVGTRSENVQDCIRKGRLRRGPPAQGARHGKAKLTESAVLSIRSDKRGQYAIAQSYGVSQSCISLIKLCKNWGHI